MKVFMVTDGIYPDYHVCGVYSNVDNAKWAQKLFAADTIEEVELDGLPDAPPGLLYFSVYMDARGDSEVRPENATYAVKHQWEPYGDDERVSFHVWAKDAEHAVKIANERRAQLIASGQWTTDWDEWMSAKNQGANRA